MIPSFSGSSAGKESKWLPCPVLWLGKFHGQGACQATGHGVTKSWTRLRDIHSLRWFQGLPWWFSDKEPAYRWRRLEFDPWVRKIPWRRKWQPTLLFLPRESHGKRSLVDYGPWGHKELDTTEVTEHPHTHLKINKLNQISCNDKIMHLNSII